MQEMSHPINPMEHFKQRLEIFHAIDQPIRNLSIDDICEKCNISRSKFYHYFKTREDLYYWYAIFCGSLALDEIGRTLTWHEGLTQHFIMLYNEKDVLKYTAMREPSSGTQYMERYRQQIITTTLRDYKHTPITPPLQFQIKVWTHIEAWAAPEWFRSEMSIEPRLLAQYFDSCVPRELHAALEL